MECFDCLRNVQDLLSDGKTPMRGVLGNHSKDRSFRLVHWLSITLSLRKTVKNHQFGKKVLLGLFLGYELYAGWYLEG